MKSVIKVIEKLISVMFIAMCTVALLQVTMRYVFNKPFYWAEEFILSIFTWVAFVGAALALRKSQHARITILIDKFPKDIRLKVEIGGKLLVAALSALIFFQSIKYNGLANTIKLSALRVPQSMVSFGITFASVMMFIFSIEAIVDLLRNKEQKTETKTTL